MSDHLSKARLRLLPHAAPLSLRPGIVAGSSPAGRLLQNQHRLLDARGRAGPLPPLQRPLAKVLLRETLATQKSIQQGPGIHERMLAADNQAGSINSLWKQ